MDRGRERERDFQERYDKRDHSYSGNRGEKRRHDDSDRRRDVGVRVRDDRQGKTPDFHTIQYENVDVDYDKRSFVISARGRGRGRGGQTRGRGFVRTRGSYGPPNKMTRYALSHEDKNDAHLESKFQASLTEMENKLSKSQELFQEKLLKAVQTQNVPTTPVVVDLTANTGNESAQTASSKKATSLEGEPVTKKKKKKDDPTWGRLQIRMANSKPLMMPFGDVPIAKHDQKMRVNWSREDNFGVNGKWVNPLDRYGKMKCRWIIPEGVSMTDYDTPEIKEFLCKLDINKAGKDACFINLIKFIDNIDGASPATVWFNDENPDAMRGIAGNTRITCIYFKHALQGLAGAFFLKGHCKEAKAIQHMYYHSNYATVGFTAVNELTWVVPSPANLLAHLTDLMTNNSVEITGNTAALFAQVEGSVKGAFGVWEKDKRLPYIYNQTQPAIHLSCLGMASQYQQPMKWQVDQMKELPNPESMFIFGMGGRPWFHAKKDHTGFTTISEINKCIDPKVFQLCLGIAPHSMPPNHLQWAIRNIYFKSFSFIDTQGFNIQDTFTINHVINMLKGPWTKMDFFNEKASGVTSATEAQSVSVTQSRPPEIKASMPANDLDDQIVDAKKQWEKDLQENFLALLDGQQVAGKDDVKSLERFVVDVVGLPGRQIPDATILHQLKTLQTDFKKLSGRHDTLVNELKYVYSIFNKQISVLQITGAMLNCMRTIQLCHPSEFESNRDAFVKSWEKITPHQKLLQYVQELAPALIEAERDLVRISKGYRMELPDIAQSPSNSSIAAHKVVTSENMEVFAIGCSDPGVKKNLMEFKRASTFNVRGPTKGTKSTKTNSIVQYTQSMSSSQPKSSRKKNAKKVDAVADIESGFHSHIMEEDVPEDPKISDVDGDKDDLDEDVLLDLHNKTLKMGSDTEHDEEALLEPLEVNPTDKTDNLLEGSFSLSSDDESDNEYILYNREFESRDFFVPVIPVEDRLVRTKNPRFTRAIGGSIDALHRHIVRTDLEIEQIRFKHKLVYPQDEFDRNDFFVFTTLFGINFLQLLDDIIAFVPSSQDWSFNLVKKDAHRLIRWYCNNKEHFSKTWRLLAHPDSKFHLTSEEDSFNWPRMGDKTLKLIIHMIPICIPDFPSPMSHYFLKFFASKMLRPDDSDIIKEKIQKHRQFFHIDNDPYSAKKQHRRRPDRPTNTSRAQCQKQSVASMTQSEYWAKPERVFIKMHYTLYENDLRTAFQILLNKGNQNTIPSMARVVLTQIPSSGLTLQVPFINFTYLYNTVTEGIFLPKMLTIADIELFQTLANDFSFPDSCKMLVTKSEENPTTSPSDIDVCPKGFFLNLNGVMPKFHPTFQRIFNKHKLDSIKKSWAKVNESTDYWEATPNDDHIMMGKTLDNIIHPTTTIGKIKILSVNLNLFQSQFFTLNKSVAKSDIYLVQELNLTMNGFNAIRNKLEKEFHIFHHSPVWETGDSLRCADHHLYSMILVNKSLNVTLKQIKDISPPATMVIMHLDNDSSIFLTTIYATRLNQKLKNTGLGIGLSTNLWLQYYTGLYKQIAAAHQGGMAIFAGDINMDIETFRHFDSKILTKIFVSLFEDYTNLVTGTTFRRGRSVTSQIDIFMTYNLNSSQFKTWDGKIMVHNDGHSLLQAIFDLDITAKNNSKVIQVKHKPSDDLLDIAWLIVRLKNDAIMEESYTKHAADISTAGKTGIFPKYAGKDAKYVTQVTSALEHTITVCSPLYPAKIVNCRPIPYEDKDTAILRKTLLDWRNLAHTIPKELWDKCYTFGLSVLKRRRNENQVQQLIFQVGKRLHINSWRLLKLELSTFGKYLNLDPNIISPTALTKQFHELQRRGFSRKCTITWPKFEGTKFSFDDWSFDYEGRRDQGSSLRQCLLDSRSPARGYNSSLSAPLLKHLPYSLSRDFTRICQIVLKLGCFPTPAKNMKIVTIPKNVSAENPDLLKRLRCLSIQQCMDSAIQRKVSTLISQFLINEKLITDVQHGFRKGRSCSTLFGELMVDLNEARLRKRKYAILLSYDVKNAFGSIDHEALKDRLAQICETAPLLYFAGVLDNRTSTMKFGGVQGDTLMAHAIGVPQGTPLAPILFALWMSGLEEICAGNPDIILRLYADDANVLVLCDDLDQGRELAEEASNHLIKLLLIRGVQLAASKSRCIAINLVGKSSENRSPLVINTTNGVIEETTELKLLGVDFHNTLNFGNRVQKLKSAMYQNSGKALNITNILSTDKALLWMKSTNIGVFSYASEVLPLYTDNQYETLDKTASLPALDILGLQHLKAKFLTTRVLNSLSNKPSFKDWHIKNILVFSSEVVRKRDPIKIADFIVKNLSFSNGDPYKPGKVLENYCRGIRIKFDRRAAGDLFPCNLGKCLSLIPAKIANLFGTYTFVHKLKSYTNAKCPHGALVADTGETCAGCTNEKIAITRIRLNQRMFNTVAQTKLNIVNANNILNGTFTSTTQLISHMKVIKDEFDAFLESLDYNPAPQ